MLFPLQNDVLLAVTRHVELAIAAIAIGCALLRSRGRGEG